MAFDMMINLMIEAEEDLPEEREISLVAYGIDAAKLRVQKDINDLFLPKDSEISFPKGSDDLMTLEVTICPDEGYYRDGKFVFSLDIPSSYPYNGPRVNCKTPVFHPNIDCDGNVGLNILREDWRPVLDITLVVYGLYHIFMEPNCETFLNEAAAMLLRDNPSTFEALVQESIPRKDSFILDMDSLAIVDRYLEK